MRDSIGSFALTPKEYGLLCISLHPTIRDEFVVNSVDVDRHMSIQSRCDNIKKTSQGVPLVCLARINTYSNCWYI
jgi:hypothetical protein